MICLAVFAKDGIKSSAILAHKRVKECCLENEEQDVILGESVGM